MPGVRKVPGIFLFIFIYIAFRLERSWNKILDNKRLNVSLYITKFNSMARNLKPCGECGAPQAIAIDGCPHCTKCESDLFPAGGRVHPDNLTPVKKVVSKAGGVDEENDEENEE